MSGQRDQTDVIRPLSWRARYRLRLKRRQLLWRSFQSRRQLCSRVDRTDLIQPDDLLVFMVVRNEAMRLPYFLKHYRNLGVAHFLVVDNGSTDGSAALLAQEQDVSLWKTDASYRASRFGLDWSTWLQIRYGHGHWCLTVDADELLVYDGCAQHDLNDLARLLDSRGQQGFGALMLDLFPDGALGDQRYEQGSNPCAVLRWFDAGPFRSERQLPMGNLWLQGGARERVFFADNPRQSPTLNKIPLVKWHRRYAYVNSTHSLLPPAMNGLYDGPQDNRPCGVILHTKFLPDIVSRSEIERQRQQHFNHPENFTDYYDDISASPNMKCENSVEYNGVSDLVQAGLMPNLHWN